LLDALPETPTRDNADQLFVLVRAPDFYLHHVEVVNQDTASAD